MLLCVSYIYGAYRSSIKKKGKRTNAGDVGVVHGEVFYSRSELFKVPERVDNNGLIKTHSWSTYELNNMQNGSEEHSRLSSNIDPIGVLGGRAP